jgi:hypothetical protein
MNLFHLVVEQFASAYVCGLSLSLPAPPLFASMSGRIMRVEMRGDFASARQYAARLARIHRPI